MTEWPRLPRAPIVEALLDLRATFASPVQLAQLESFHEAMRERYPTKEPRLRWEGEIHVAQEAVQQALKRGPEGFLFRSTDGRRSIQVRQDGFTFNWLKPYDTWQSLRNEAREHWERYWTMFRPEAVNRIALRYINRLELPLPFQDFRDYVQTAPDIAPGLPQGVRTFFMRLEIPDETRGLIAIVTETIQSPVDDGKRVPFILDIDVIREATFEPGSSAIWDTFEQIRDFKNDIFFKSLTPKALELFK